MVQTYQGRELYNGPKHHGELEGNDSATRTLLWRRVFARISGHTKLNRRLGEGAPVRILKAVLHEELSKAGKTIACWYKTVREIDVRTMETLIELLGRPK